MLQPLQRFLRYLSLRQQRPTALGNGAFIAHVDGMEPDLFQRFPLVLAHPDDTPPEHRIGGKAAFPGVGTGLEEISWGMLMAEVEPSVTFGGNPGDRLILENEIAEAVENGRSLVDLNAT